MILGAGLLAFADASFVISVFRSFELLAPDRSLKAKGFWLAKWSRFRLPRNPTYSCRLLRRSPYTGFAHNP